jgi:hypothetical protein
VDIDSVALDPDPLLSVDARDFHAAIVSMVPSRYTIAKSCCAPGGAEGPGATLIN